MESIEIETEIKPTLCLSAHEQIIKARFYRWVMHTYNGQWGKASADVFAVTGVNIPVESLRQNIEPVSKKSGLPPRRFKNPERLAALKDFLISVKYLYVQELLEPVDSSYAAIALSEFINGEDNPESFGGLENFKGLFVCERWAADYTEHIELQIDYVSKNQAVRVTEISTFEHPSHSSLDDRVEHEGWGVCNGNGFYIFLLHNKEEQSTKCYLVLQTLPKINGNTPLTDIALVAYESAWANELHKVTIEIHDRAEKVDYSLPKKMEDLCLFFTRA